MTRWYVKTTTQRNAEDSTHHFDDRNSVNLTWQWIFFHDLLFIPTMVFQMPQWHKAKGTRMGKISPLRWDSSFLANQAATAAGAVALEGSEIPGEEDVTHRFSQGNTYFREFEWAKIVLGNTPGPFPWGCTNAAVHLGHVDVGSSSGLQESRGIPSCNQRWQWKIPHFFVRWFSYSNLQTLYIENFPAM